MRLLALFAPFTDKMSDFSTVLYTSTNEIPTLSCTQSPNKVPFSGWAFCFGHNRECPLGGTSQIVANSQVFTDPYFLVERSSSAFHLAFENKNRRISNYSKEKKEEEEEGRKTTLNRLNCEKSRRESSPRIISRASATQPSHPPSTGIRAYRHSESARCISSSKTYLTDGLATKTKLLHGWIDR